MSLFLCSKELVDTFWLGDRVLRAARPRFWWPSAYPLVWSQPLVSAIRDFYRKGRFSSFGGKYTPATSAGIPIETKITAAVKKPARFLTIVNVKLEARGIRMFCQNWTVLTYLTSRVKLKTCMCYVVFRTFVGDILRMVNIKYNKSICKCFDLFYKWSIVVFIWIRVHNIPLISSEANYIGLTADTTVEVGYFSFPSSLSHFFLPL